MATFQKHAASGDGCAALLSVALNHGACVSLSRQLYLQISEHIRSGRLAPGARLTSTRKLSLDLGVSRTVTLTAYDQLASEGYIESIPGSGVRVSSLLGVRGQSRKQVERRFEADERGPGFLIEGQPFDPTAQVGTIFPRTAWVRLLARGWRKQGRDAEAQGNWFGLPSLRDAIARHVYSLRGIVCTFEQILITSGNADALQLIVHGLAPTPGDRKAGVWIEDPGYLSARKILADAGMCLIPVPIDDAGLDVAAGRRKREKARFALVTPSRQFPLGMPLSLSRRLALITWADDVGSILIEDDYDTEVRFCGRPIPSLLSLDRDVNALSLGSFSKVTFPGLRLGYIVGNKRLIRRLAEARARTGALIGTTAQPALAEFLDEGGFARHMRQLRREVAARREALVIALTERLADKVTILPQEVGMHLTVTLKRGGASDAALSAKAATIGLHLQPLSAHFSRPTKRQGFLLGYAGWSNDKIVSAVDDLCKLLS